MLFGVITDKAKNDRRTAAVHLIIRLYSSASRCLCCHINIYDIAPALLRSTHLFAFPVIFKILLNISFYTDVYLVYDVYTK